MEDENEINYKYLDNKTPNSKIEYSYSKYLGDGFVLGYLKSRENCINDLARDENSIYLDDLKSNTEELLNNWIRNIKTNKNFKTCDLQLLLKRFEVTKKIYDDYNYQFRPTNKKKFNNLKLYVLFSYVLCIAYEKYKELQYLNCLLKVNDINISNRLKLDKKSKALLCKCVKMELKFINHLDNYLKN